MTAQVGPVEVPNRALFKAAEVCELTKVQPYVLRSWETEFPDLGISKTPGAPRIYRRADVEQVLRIKHLLLVEGLTLAGARRKLQEEAAPVVSDAPLEELVGRNARERLTEVKRGLRALLELLTAAPAARHEEFQLASPVARGQVVRAMPVVRTKAPPASRAKSSSRSRKGA